MIELFEFDKAQMENKIGGLNIQLSSYDAIIGCDEAGRGPAAGDVYTAAVSFKENIPYELFQKLNDSKKLSPKLREELYDVIKQYSYWSITSLSIKEIEKMNILQASLFGMKKCVLEVIKKRNSKSPLCLVDGNCKIKFDIKQKPIVKGDSKSASIAAASILAKVERDRYMDVLDKKYPNYHFQKNKGYLTKEHIKAIKEYGICEYHRKSFLKNYI